MKVCGYPQTLVLLFNIDLKINIMSYFDNDIFNSVIHKTYSCYVNQTILKFCRLKSFMVIGKLKKTDWNFTFSMFWQFTISNEIEKLILHESRDSKLLCNLQYILYFHANFILPFSFSTQRFFDLIQFTNKLT